MLKWCYPSKVEWNHCHKKVRIKSIQFRRTFIHSRTRNNNNYASNTRAQSVNNNGIFTNKNWLIRKPQFKNIPKIERNDFIERFQFEINPKKYNNVYTKDLEFKKNLDMAMNQVFHNKMKSFDKNESQLKRLVWNKLRDYIYAQLQQKDLDKSISQYKPILSQMIQPCNPEHLICQLAKCNSFASNTWAKILGKTDEQRTITTCDKYYYLLSKTFDYIYGQEIIPTCYEDDTIDPNPYLNAEVNISDPAEWFVEARKMKRHIIMHLGPTNSGKTYKALQKLKTSESGYYAGPLRLLAREVYDTFKSQGIRCNLLTGEEIIKDLDSMGNSAKLTSGTVEMIPLNKKFDVIVLDEIQMMNDEDRGWAWTNALLGVQAREVHLCGEKSALPLISKIIKLTGDRLTINEYERLGELKVESEVLKRGLYSLRKGDCIVAFSKKKILDLKLQIEAKTNLKVAVIYGSLPPETRVQQAQLFNEGECHVLVASDAIGMGLNLSIDRIIFTTDLKYNGKELMKLTNSNIKQIGGRAGRFKFEGNGPAIGSISSLHTEVLDSVKEGIEAPIEYLKKAVIWPTDKICEQLMIRFPPGTKVGVLLQTLSDQLEAGSNKLFKVSGLDNKFNVIKLFEDMEDIPFLDKLKLSNAPVKNLPMVQEAFSQFCLTISKKETRTLLSYPFPFYILQYKNITNDDYGLERYEALYNIIMLFFWLSNRYPNYFVDLESATDLKHFCEMMIFEKLNRLSKNPYIRKFPSIRNSKNPKMVKNRR
ncbi:ATP-dependent RNA helicase SUV3 NDAI_0E03190 [Naumovozyma dairenensis CBS 421]|uniref:ATP-dependent RNA helicase SUV3, mitochondrial n=1 Tax=Naumovozyma dairenensis (strain ATCC 10597 / BCRC 20456 / CBS 421 / NBRC 0211 / NRRL Y-12639) TaxID=1071378 RepID=G0WBL6_NAUDC|nr:hypothetical protein NDAI_0E03190 [Naumovozyma dairenensis CBS 421]CCD25136.1 hypothetical protein NDAI_0E03190 [Naumovozyma dairenensis CBS 421]